MDRNLKLKLALVIPLDIPQIKRGIDALVVCDVDSDHCLLDHRHWSRKTVELESSLQKNLGLVSNQKVFLIINVVELEIVFFSWHTYLMKRSESILNSNNLHRLFLLSERNHIASNNGNLFVLNPNVQLINFRSILFIEI